mmetsp:Transcript_1609/g.1666  ORF Transcript_1609/g.1666 Transcript_1609/m.1666 type:complete len:120 (-) Transcript_1609:182-541(-)|eukprot:CAMPEP_0171321304 /NCGR_PEP_ID=MMETSP0816-20121228/111095_1 /TAXON_ID=420281 /ORGANISM="Proboscia inermis, Strain CCAP1064/1" /LENGTH=119 /DNA_ID=CAMNT_0011819131 /DNA_START=25 /DNA_END=384 /DNA_ORIENTATION=-
MSAPAAAAAASATVAASATIVPAGVGIPPAPTSYVMVQGHTIVIDDPLLTEVATMQQILHWIGFQIEINRNNLLNNSIGSFTDMLSLIEKDIQEITTNWANRANALGRFHIGTRRQKSL